MKFENTHPTWERTSRQLQLAAILMVVFAVGIFFGTQYSSVLAQNSGRIQLSNKAEEALQPLFETYNLIEDTYIDDIESKTLIDGAIRGMVNSLDDQYSGYVDAENFRFVDENLSGSIQGIGVVISENQETGEIQVINVLRNTPAEMNGIEEGDTFVIVNGEEVIGLTYLELASRVRGEAGTNVDITMRRDDQLIDFTIERARIEVPNIRTELLDGDIAYISMAEFSAIAREQVDTALGEFDLDSINGLIFDLRGNPGGFLDTATEIAGLFLENGIILKEEFGDGEERIFEIRQGVVYEVFDNGNDRVYSENAAHVGIEAPVVVLVDERSASASELVSGAWQDNGTAVIMGATTFGKGTVQTQHTLVNGGGVRLTIARWLTPEGHWISGEGVTPDIVVKLPEDYEPEPGIDPQLEAAIQYILTGQAIIPEVSISDME